MKPAREPASSRPKPCAFLKKPHESCPFAAPCGPRRKKNDRGQRSAFPSETSRLKPVILAHRGSALPWLVNDRAALRLRRIWCVVSATGMQLRHPINSGLSRWRLTTLWIDAVPESRMTETNPGVSTRFSLSVENERADAGRDGQRTYLTRPNYVARTGTGKFQYPCSGSIIISQPWRF